METDNEELDPPGELRKQPDSKAGYLPRRIVAHTRVLDLNALGSLFRVHWRIFAIVVVVVTGAVTATAFALKPRFTSQLAIFFDPGKRFDPNAALAGAVDPGFVDTEIGKLTARPVIEMVVDRLSLETDPEFSAAEGDETEPTALRQQRARESAIGTLQKRLRVERQGATYIASLSITSFSAEKSQRIAATFPEAYVAIRGAQQNQALAALNEQLATLSAAVQEAEVRLTRYQASRGLIRSGDNAGSTLTDQQIGSMSANLAVAESELATAESRMQTARAQAAATNSQDVIEVARSPVIAEYRRQRALIANEQASVTERYGPLHPETRRVEKQLAEIDAKIREEAGRVQSAIQGEVAAAQGKVNSLRTELDRLRALQAGNAQDSVEAARLERDVEAKRQTYTPLAQAAQRIAQQLETVPATVIAPATLPRLPSFPNKPLFAVIGLFLGTILGAALILIFDLLDHSVREASQVENDIGLPLLGWIPAVAPKLLREAGVTLPWDFQVKRPRSAYAESLRTIRGALQATRRSTGGEVICVTSALPKEGKSTTAVSLARIMAASGDKTIVIDADVHRGSIKSLVPANLETGLLQVLRKEGTLQQAIVQDTVEGLHLLALADGEVPQQDMLGSRRMATLLRTLRGHYRFVILDAPPLLALSDARTLALAADRVILVARWGKTPMAAVQSAVAQLQHANANIAGMVLTQVDVTARARLGEMNPYYYYRDVRDYYAN